MNVSGKFKRMGKSGGYRPDWKKALVTIQKGQTINKFGGA
jgi:large subunit ribosomal protein L23